MKYRFAYYAIIWCVFKVPCGFGAENALVFREDFNAVRVDGLSALLVEHPRLEIVEGVGVHGTPGLRATYKGYERGSERIVDRFELGERGSEYTLNYDVRFDEDFQFVKGGKLHGLGPEAPITGGKAMSPDGWSARVTFKEGGSVRSYLYCQGKDGMYGVGIGNPDFRFEKGNYYAVTLHVKLNTDVNESDGFAHIYINGRRIIAHDDVRFRGQMGDDTLISKFMFSTFHGGHEPHWAPKDANGGFADVHAYFDNIAVYRGLRVRSEPGG